MTPVELYTLIASALVAHPESLRVTAVDKGDRGVVIHVTADDSDYGKLIGSQGANFKACDDLIQLAAIRSSLKSCTLKIDTTNARAALTTRFSPKFDWGEKDDADLIMLVRRIVECASDGLEVTVRASQINNSTMINVTCGFLHYRGRDAVKTVIAAIARNRGRLVCVDIEVNENTFTHKKASCSNRW